MRKGITFKGKHSYKDFGLTLKSRYISIPQKKKIKVSVPFQSGTYDFSHLYGSQAYEERECQYVFHIRGDSIQEMEVYQQDVLNWLLHSPKEKLYDDYIPGYYFLAECESAEFNDLNYIGELTVNFAAYPFKIAELPEGHDIWDKFNFVTDFAQDTKFHISGEKQVTLYNPSAINIVPIIRATSQFEIVKDRTTYTVNPGETKDWRFSLDIGENKMTIRGSGEIEFIFWKEVV